MDASWDFYIRQVENRHAYIFVDSALAKVAPLGTHPKLVSCRIEVNSFRNNGLPDKKAFETIYGFEDAANEIANKSGQSIYAGRYGIGRELDYHFYVTTGDTLISDFETSAELKAITPFVCTTHLDSGWSVYLTRLIPLPAERNSIENTKVREQLLKAGDDLTVPRIVDHYAYFETTEGLNGFRGTIEQLGYVVVEAAALRNEQGLFALSFTKSQSPAELDPITWSLSQLAEKHKGSYDGWGCPVVHVTK